MATFRSELRSISATPSLTPKQAREALLQQAQGGDVSAADDLFDLTLSLEDDVDLHFDYVVEIPTTVLPRLVAERPDDLLLLVERVGGHLDNNFGTRDFNWVNRPLGWMLDVARAAEAAGDVDLLEDVSVVLLDQNAGWDRYRQYRPLRQWLSSLAEPAQHAVAAALRRDSRACAWLSETVEVQVDERPILYAALQAGAAGAN
ncbi:hypothetical protein FTX61_20020 [Nitriliruptoraceae bacterium ZYF776]|nr:hypothetical protein [Profundirhabdus halotolerans]